MIDFNFILEILPRLLNPFKVTIAVSLIALVLGLLLGLTLGLLWVMSAPRRPLRMILNSYVWFVRGTPIIIQIYIAYFFLPKLGFNWDVFWVGVVALTVNSVGYQIEIVRAAIASVNPGQQEAALSIGMTNRTSMVWIVLPQALRRMIPPLTNELANLVKASSILSVISLFELTKAGDAIIASSFRFVEVLSVLSIFYFVIVQVLSRIAQYLENRVFNYGQSTALAQVQ
ncbi:MAG: amino acid ABC transporter permease [Cyanobacteria bacterium P01_F01_bin.86]